MSNRKATAARIITSTPVFTTQQTQFGKVKVKTSQFHHTIRYPTPRGSVSRLMTQAEKELRKKIKKLKGDKSKAFEVAQLRLELNKVLYN